jgi:hypothetical protein
MTLPAEQFFGVLISVRAEQRGWVGTAGKRGQLHLREIECSNTARSWRERSPLPVNFWEIVFRSAGAVVHSRVPAGLQVHEVAWRRMRDQLGDVGESELAHSIAWFLFPKDLHDDPRVKLELRPDIERVGAWRALRGCVPQCRFLLADVLSFSTRALYPDLFRRSSSAGSGLTVPRPTAPLPSPQPPAVRPASSILAPGPVRAQPLHPGSMSGSGASPGAATRSAQPPAVSASSAAAPAGSPRLPSVPAQPPARPADWVWRPPDPTVPPSPAREWERSIDGFARSVDAPDALLVGATVRGRGHKQDGLYGDDSFALGLAGGWRILVVSDGAGSAKLSRFGSHLATTTALRQLEHGLQTLALDARVLEPGELAMLDQTPELARVRDCICRAFAASATAISDWVADRNIEASGRGPCRAALDRAIREGASSASKHAGRIARTSDQALVEIVPTDCSATLLVAVSTRVLVRSSDGSAREAVLVASCAIGDGMMAVFRRAGGKPPHSIDLMVPDAGAYSGESVFLSESTARSEQVAARVRFHIVGSPADVVAIAAMTDGVADDYYGEVVGMNRLHCDLIVNNLMPSPASGGTASADDASAVVDEEFLCDQAASLGLASSARRFPVAYSDRRLAALGRTPDDALKDPAVLTALASTQASKMAGARRSVGGAGAERGERIRDWLDTYRARGSYDDRTLVLCLLRATQGRV